MPPSRPDPRDSQQTGRLARWGTNAWRLLGIGLLVVGVWLLARRVMPVLVPLVVALLLAALVRPVAAALERRGAPPALAALVSTALLVTAVAIALLLIVPPFVSRVGDLSSNVEEGLRRVVYSAGHDIAGISHHQANQAVDDLLSGIRNNRSRIVGDVLVGASAVAQALASIVLTLFLCFFVVKDGDRIGRWALSFAARERRPALEALGLDVWSTLATYIRGVIFVATVDAVFIGLALILVGVPLAMPLIVLTWIAAFFPIIGAVTAGVVSVLVALVSGGLGDALIVLAAILAVQQLEGNVLYPAVVGPRLRLHPLTVLLAVAIGATIGGVAGAFLAVPVATVGAVVLDHRRPSDEQRTDVELPSSIKEERELVIQPGR
jgi:predicted PurR-regulated permease PerM